MTPRRDVSGLQDWLASQQDPPSLFGLDRAQPVTRFTRPMRRTPFLRRLRLAWRGLVNAWRESAREYAP